MAKKKKIGRPADEHEKANISLRVRTEVYSRLKEEAARDGRSLSKQVEQILLERYGLK